MNSTTTTITNNLPRRTIARWAQPVDLVLLGCILIGVLLLRLPGMVLPLERDEGAYAYVATTWLQGGLPYREAFDHKPPFIYLLYMPPLLLPLPPVAAIRLWSTILCLVSTGLVFVVGRHVWPARTALLAALIYGSAGSAFDLQGLILNTDQALVLPALGALWAAIRLAQTQHQRFAVVLGVAWAAAVFVKPVAVVLGTLVVLACLRQPRDAAKALSAVSFGVAAVIVPVATYFWTRGGWDEFLFGVWTYNRLYAMEAQVKWQIEPLVDMFVPFVPLLLVALGGSALLRSRPAEQRYAGWLVVVWTGALLIAAVGSLRAFIHYYYPVLPGLALLAAPCIPWLWKQGRGLTRIEQITGWTAPTLLAILVIGPFAVQNIRLIGTTAEQQAIRLYGDAGKYYFTPAQEVAEYVREHTEPEDYIYLFAAEPEVYLLAQRRSASRYIYDYPFGLLPQASAELSRDLAANPPKIIITYMGVRPELLATDPYLAQFSKVTEIGGYEIFAIK